MDHKDNTAGKCGRTLFVSDLDGTLLQPDSRLSARTIELLNRAIDKGALFTAATARTPATVSSLLDDVKMSLPAIVMTGAALWDVHSHRYSDVCFMNPETVSQILDIYRSVGCPTFVYTLHGNMIDIYRDGPMSDLEHAFMEERSLSKFKKFHIHPGETLLPENNEDVVLLYSMQPNSVSRAAWRKAVAEKVDARMQFYHDLFGEEVGILEAFSPEATKAKAIERVKRLTGADRVVAFGDNINDLPMLRAADLAVAVDNAIPEVKEAADIVIGPNTDNSVAKFIFESL